MSNDHNSVNEIRILIDVSGSMKLNDPANLRIPALELLINLLPANTRAGIWLFSEQTHVLVPFSKVDTVWKNNALIATGKIHSRGLLTNIEEALQVATDDWIDQPPQQQRNLILLTDGMVDVAKDFMLSADSRERIITVLIPIMQRAGIQLHTIALSENADRGLMEKLAFDTNGWSETVHSADQLQRVFLKMFKKAVPQDSVPIVGNQFSIDASIKEFSVLLFRQSGAPVSQLLRPDNISFYPGKLPDNVRWLHEKNYDLVTVKNPMPGSWKIKAEIDPDNQVMIVTDLKFNLKSLPNHVNALEPLDLIAYFTDRNELITHTNFLDLITLKIQQTDATGQVHEWTVAQNKNKPGYYAQQLAESLTSGTNTLKLIADGKTFSREILRSIDVVNLPIKVSTQVNPETRTVKIQLIPDKAVIDAAFMSVQAILNYPSQVSETINVEGHSGIWTLAVKTPKKGEQVIVNFSVMAKSKQGTPITPNLQPVIIDDHFLNVEEPLEIHEPAEAKPQLAVKTTPEENKEQQSESGLDWKVTLAMVIGINLLLIIFGYFLYRYQRKKTAEQQAQLLGRLT